jgi:hypothetical protein
MVPFWMKQIAGADEKYDKLSWQFGGDAFTDEPFLSFNVKTTAPQNAC